MAKIQNRNIDRSGWHEKDNLSDMANFNIGQAVYYLSWDTATDSWYWDSKLSRSGSIKITNNDVLELLLEDNCFIEIMTSTLDKTNISMCYAELFLETYDSSNNPINRWKLDRDYVAHINTGTADYWENKNLTLQGTKKYTLNPGDYAKVWVEVNYDGTDPSVTLEGWHEQTELKY